MPSYESVAQQPAVTTYGGAPVNANGMQPRTGTARPRQNQPLGNPSTASPWGVGMQPYSATNNLIGQQIGPGESAGTQRATQNATNAQQALAGFQFGAYQPTAVADYSQANTMLTGANAQMQGAQYNYGAGNAQRDMAGNALTGGAAAANPYYQAAGGLGIGAYTGGSGSGGAAASADATALRAGLAKSNEYVGSQFADATDTQRARALTMQGLESAMNGPDRAELAARSLALLEERGQPGYEQAIRSTNQKAAAMGRRGSGLVNSELADVATTRERALAQSREAAAIDAAGQTLNDRAQQTQLGLGVTQGFGGEDRAGVSTRLNQAGQLAANANSDFNANAVNAGFQDAAYGRMEQAAGRQAQGAQQYAANQFGIGDRMYGQGQDIAAYRTGYGSALDGQENNRVGLIGQQADFQRGTANDLAGIATTNYGQRNQQAQQARADEYNQFGAAGDRATTLTGFQQQERGYDANNRNELRGERDYQNAQSQQAIDDEYRRLQYEEDLRNGRYNRAMGTWDAGNSVTQPDYGAAGANAQGQANGWNTVAGQGAQIAAYNAQQRRSGAGSGRTTTTN